MEWTTRFFLHHEEQWRIRAGAEHNHAGPKAYAARQAANWRQLALDAERLFRASNKDYITLVM
jgi:hypothetical protein